MWALALVFLMPDISKLIYFRPVCWLIIYTFLCASYIDPPYRISISILFAFNVYLFACLIRAKNVMELFFEK